MKKLFIFAIYGWMTANIFGQQTPKYTSFYSDPFLVNPAYAGYTGDKEIFVLYRQQMIDMPSSPRTYLMNYQAPFLLKNTGIGVQVFNDEVNILGYLGGKMTYSYTVELPKSQHLRFGLSLGLSNNRIVYNNVIAEDPSELLEFYNMKSYTTFLTDAGLMYELYDLELGFSLTNVALNNHRSYFNEIPYKYLSQYNVSFRYKFDLDMDWSIVPAWVIRSPQGLKAVHDISMVGIYHETMKVGAFWSPKNSIGIGFGYIRSGYKAGLSWEYFTTPLNKITYGSFELSVGYTFGWKEKKK